MSGAYIELMYFGSTCDGRMPNGFLRSQCQVEVVAFSDEEGVRFQSTFLGSRAFAGTLTPDMLSVMDADGTSLRQVSVPATHNGPSFGTGSLIALANCRHLSTTVHHRMWTCWRPVKHEGHGLT